MGKDSLDSAIVSLIREGIEEHGINTSSNEIPDEIIDNLFSLSLDVLGDTSSTMRTLPREKKLQLIKQVANSTKNSLPNRVGKSPTYYADLLNQLITNGTGGKGNAEKLLDMFARQWSGQPKSSVNLRDTLAELKIQCKTQSMSWLKQFISCGGLTNLFAVLDSMHSKPGRRVKHYEIESETLKILRLIANHDSGITDILCQQDYLNILILSLDSPMLMARTATLDFLLAIVTLNYPIGHKLVMSSMEFFKGTRKYSRVFDCLVDSLKNGVTSRGIFGSKVGAQEAGLFPFSQELRIPSEKDMRDFLVSAVALIRFIVEIPPEFEYRMHLRHELISSGLLPIFQKLSSWAASEFHDILQHVVAFENLKTADFKYLLTNMDAELDVDIDDSSALLTLLKTKLDPSDTRTITSLIQNIVVGTSLIDSETRSYMLSMIEKVVMYIVLDQNGITNFTDAFKYSVDQIILGLQDIEQLQEENMKLTLLCDHQEKQLIMKPIAAVHIQAPTTTDIAIPAESLALHYRHLKKIYANIQREKIKPVLEVTRADSTSTIVSRDSVVKDSFRASLASINKIKVNSAAEQIQLDDSKGEEVARVVEVVIARPAGPPPPPPLAPPRIQRVPVKYRPSTSVRKLHWSNIAPDTFDKSVWSLLSKTHGSAEELVHKSGLMLEIDQEFEVKITAKVIKKTATADDMIKVLSEKRAQNVMIFLETLKVFTMGEFVDAIRTFEDSKMTEVLLAQTINLFPTSDEGKLLNILKTETNLRQAECFLRRMNGIYRCKERLEMELFKVSFLTNFNQLKYELLSLTHAFQSITKSKNLKKVLQIILVIGNYMNAENNRSIAGFTLSFLDKVASLKGTSGVPVINLIAKMIHDTEPEVYDCIAELRPLLDLGRISFQGAKENIAENKIKFEALTTEITKIEGYRSRSDYTPADVCFITKLAEFGRETSGKVGYLNQQVDLLKVEIDKVFAFFGERVEDKAMTPELLTSYLVNFLTGLEAAYQGQKKVAKKSAESAAKVKEVKVAPVFVAKVEKPVEGHLDTLLDNLKRRPALQSFDGMQRPKQNARSARSLVPKTKSMSESASWKIDTLNFDELKLSDLTLSFD